MLLHITLGPNFLDRVPVRPSQFGLFLQCMIFSKILQADSHHFLEVLDPLTLSPSSKSLAVLKLSSILELPPHRATMSPDARLYTEATLSSERERRMLSFPE